MGCGVSHFVQQEPELASKSNPLSSKVDDGIGYDQLLDVDHDHNYKEPQMKEIMMEKKTGDYDQNQEVDHQEDTSQKEDKEEKDHQHYYPIIREDCSKLPGSPSLRGYCDSDSGSVGRTNNGIDDEENGERCMSRVEEPPNVDKGPRVQSVKKWSRVRRIRYAISRSMKARKSLLNASCYNPNYASSLFNQPKPVAKPL